MVKQPEAERVLCGPNGFYGLEGPMLEQRIVTYYDECQWQYRLLHSSGTLAMHYGYWDAKVHTHPQALLRLQEILAESLPIPEEVPLQILDAGCGIGGSSIWLAKHFAGQAEIHGITLSQREVELATHNAASAGVSSLATFSRRDYRATGFPNEHFDAIWAIESVCHAQCKADFCQEAFRLLKPGGKLVMSDGFRRKTAYSPKQEHILRTWLDGWAVVDIVTPKAFLEDLSNAGFRDIQFSDATSHIVPDSRRLLRQARLTFFPRLMLRLVGRWSAVEEGNWRGAIEQNHALEQGLWTYGIVTAQKPDQMPA